jgi:hypothetical protein
MRCSEYRPGEVAMHVSCKACRPVALEGRFLVTPADEPNSPPSRRQKVVQGWQMLLCPSLRCRLGGGGGGKGGSG